MEANEPKYVKSTSAKDFDHNTRQISGPINVVRLEGEVHGIIKVIYLFLDVHVPVMVQTECTNVFSKDINKYLAESFYQLIDTPKTYDFFMEIRPSDISFSTQEWIKKSKSKYIHQMMKFFSMIFQYDKDKNKVSISDYFKNIRLHYLDVRDYLQHHITNIMNESVDISSRFMCNGIYTADFINRPISFQSISYFLVFKKI